MTEQNMYQLKSLGDPHNFGKATYLRSDGKIVKPRNTAWEKAFLSRQSPLRQQIDLIGRAAGMRVPLADLTYRQLAQGGSSVDSLQGETPVTLTTQDLEATGVFLAIAVWFGMTDLDAENIVTGRDGSGNLIITPVDIETVLIPLSDIAETGLINSLTTGQRSEGLNTIRSLIRSTPPENGASILVGSFSSFLSLLQQNRHELALEILPLLQEPVRIRLRPSDLYRTEFKSNNGDREFSEKLLDEEKFQLSRGDIPYFLALPNRDQLFWFDTGESMKQVAPSSRLIATFTGKLPVWPQIKHQQQFSARMKQCIQEIVRYFWQDDYLKSAYSGTEISNGPEGLHIKSDGRYLPFAHKTENNI